MKILITGSAGMLGLAAKKKLSEKYQIVGIDIKDADYICDITDYNKIKEIIEIEKPDYILHCAALINVDECEVKTINGMKVNYFATHNLAKICKDNGIKLIYISTSMVFDGKRKTPYNEKDEPNPLNIYAYTKYLGEVSIRNILEDYIIVRTNIIGKKGYGKWLMESLGKEVKYYKNININSIEVESLIKNIELIIDKVGIYHITSRDYLSKFEVAKMMKMKFNITTKTKGMNYNGKVSRPLNAVLDCTKFELGTNIKLPTISESLDKLVGGYFE